jgi:hypothetical protein
MLHTFARSFTAVALVLGLLPGCGSLRGQTREPAYVGNGPGPMSLPPHVVYQDATGPLAYRSVPVSPGPLREVRGEACQSAITFPLALVWGAIESGNPANASAFLSAGWGNAGYAEAVASARQSAPHAPLVNVRADLHTRIILGVWRQECVCVVGSVAATN